MSPHPYEAYARQMPAALAAIKAQGFCIPARLSPQATADLQAFLLARPVFFDAHVPQTSRNRGDMEPVERAAVAASECICVHTDDAIVAPGLIELGLEYLPLASTYLGRDPAVSYSANAFWTRPGTAAVREDIQAFHVDSDDVRFLALFVYLTDVFDPADGPHDLIGPDGTTRTIYGQAGTIFIADTSLPHRGRKPARRERGLAWWRWGVSDRPEAGVWDKIEPVSASRIPGRYPADPAARQSIRLLVTQPDSV